MQEQKLIPHLFRTEYRKIVAVLGKRFGFAHIEMAQDIASETFLLAAETWGLKGLPQNPTAWLYTVAKNKAKDLLKHNAVFSEKIALQLKNEEKITNEFEIDLSNKNINDSQLRMMFAVCHPGISVEAQIGLALHILCGFGVEEIADAFLSNKETIYKRLNRAKQKLREENVEMELPPASEIDNRLQTVLTTIYLLFSEGYYSSSQNTLLRKDLCLEALRLNVMLVENEQTDTPKANALLALICFHSSRFEARTNQNGEAILYEDQNNELWNQELIRKGEYYLNRASIGKQLSKFHVEAAIAYWHTQKNDTKEKWESILQLYNRLLIIEYSPIAALNRTYALAKTQGKLVAISEAEKLQLNDNHLYHSLLGHLYNDVENEKALQHFNLALSLAKTNADKLLIVKNIERLKKL